YTSDLGALQLPSLFLWGKYDLVVPLELGQQAYVQCGSSKKAIHVFDHSGHSPMMNEMESFVHQVRTWINSL
ncbi:MAG: alpha/beta fold hydrolase, partial [Bacteroidia bacterium]